VFEPLRVGGPPLGIVDTARYVPKSVTLAPGDLLFLYSDGVTEAENPTSDLFGSERLEQALREARGRPAREVVEHVVQRVTAFASGAPQSDDITCMAVVRGEAQ
jgi:sigma-B regulation protein RsbU (phosphoserine phosphatase)